MRIAVAGGSGFLGSRLADRFVADGHQVLVLSRRADAGTRPWEAPRSRAAWAPDGSVGAWASVLEPADVVINLAGESIADGRWTTRRKAQIRDSRVLATRSLVDALATRACSARVLVNASAQGYYGNRGDEELTEESAPGDDFLARVCVDWEAEARRAPASVRVVMLRTGIVLARDGGALPRMLTLFGLGGGGRMGRGTQYMAWIHVDDWIEMAAWAVASPGLRGPLNVAAPVPVRNREFAAALGSALGRPAFIAAPALALRLALGELADSLLLGSTRMIPARALALGFAFEHPSLDETLRQIAGGRS